MGGDGAVDDAAAESKGTGEVHINIRCSDGSKFSVQISLESTVESFREAIAQKRHISPNQRLISQGRVLRNDRQTLKSYGLEDGHTVDLTRESAPAATTSPTGVTKDSTNSPSLTKDPKKTPAKQKLLTDPEKLLDLIMRNPEMQEIMYRNPEFAHIINDPDSLRQVLEAQNNPEILKEMMRIADIEVNNIESSPGGLNLLKSMYLDFEEPLLDATLMAGAGTQGGQAINPSTDFSSTSSEAIACSSSPNTSPLPNPWTSTRAGCTQNDTTGSTSGGNTQAPTLSTQPRQKPVLFNQTPDKTMMQNPEAFQPARLSQLGLHLSTQESGRATGVQDPMIPSNMSDGLGTGSPAVPNSNRDEPPEQLYATQLSQLQEMGFSDTQENVRALTATSGDVHEAVKRLSGNSGQ